MNVKDFTLLKMERYKNKNTLSFGENKTKNTRKTQKVITVDKPQLKEDHSEIQANIHLIK